MLTIITIITALLSLAAVFTPIILVRKKGTNLGGGALTELVEQIEEKDTKLEELAQNPDDFASLGQLEYASSQLTELRTAIDAEKEALKVIEGKLTSCQKQVEEKEANQQEVKSVKEEDERKLAELLDNYQQISSESVLLEQNLANSLKDLDNLVEELDLNQIQRAVLHDLSEALLSAGSRLRELLGEYESINGRLLSLQGQHADLESEYTKLVERHLGS